MRCPRVRLSIHRFFLWICATTFLLTVWLGGFSRHADTAARANDVQQLVQSGVASYQSGEFTAAISPWLTAYAAYETTQDLPALAIVSENLARAYQQLGQTSVEIEYWAAAIAATQSLNNPAKVGRLFTEQAQAYSRLGQHRRAIALLCGSPVADEISTSKRDSGFIAENNVLETTSQACLPGSALHLAETTDDDIGQIAALGSLAEAQRLSGQADSAFALLERGLDISRKLAGAARSQAEQQSVIKMESALLNGLGNLSTNIAQVSYRRAAEAQAIRDRDAASLLAKANSDNLTAISSFEESYRLTAAQVPAQVSEQAAAADSIQPLLNLVPAYERAGDTATAQQYWQLAFDSLKPLPDAQTKAFAAIRLADLLEPSKLRDAQTALMTPKPSHQIEVQSVELLNQALAIGKAIQNPSVVSFALGKLGRLDERMGRYPDALEKTQQARLAANQGLVSQDSLYLWDWQTGRILRAQGNLEDAEQAYRQAVSLLEEIRSNILNASQDLQFDFRDTVAPVYRQYAELNLESVPTDVMLTKGEKAFEELDNTLVTLDSLKVAELQSYFANDCVITPAAERVDAVGDSVATAVLSTAILDAESFDSAASRGEKQLAVVISLPDGRKKVSQTSIDSQAIEREIQQFRDTLESGGSQYITEYNFEPSKRLYDWLIRPFEADLADVTTLVFVNDGLLRSVPMAALYDGDRYLIEKFAVATTPSLTLTEPKKINRPTSLSALLMGVSEKPAVAGRRFDSLPAVDRELATVAEKLPDSKVLLNEDFSIAALTASLDAKDYRILHMATHGTFGFDPADNFVVAGAKQPRSGEFNETLTISELDRLIRSVSDPTREPIELLTLTACETAVGDTRSTLGLAGVAIRAGARSAIATLWSVSDGSSADLIAQFYGNLQDTQKTKAAALRDAQIAMIQSDNFVNVHPYRWAPFILIGNWL